jgi:hypothetical protein
VSYLPFLVTQVPTEILLILDDIVIEYNYMCMFQVLSPMKHQLCPLGARCKVFENRNHGTKTEELRPECEV